MMAEEAIAGARSGVQIPLPLPPMSPAVYGLFAGGVSVRAELVLVEHRLLTRLGNLVVAITGVLIAIHYTH